METQTTEYKQQWDVQYLAYISGFANVQGAKVFYLAGFIENRGRGYEKIRNTFAKENLQVPTFEQVRGGVLATIQREVFVALNKQSGGNVSTIDQINDRLNDRINSLQLTDNEKNVFYLIKTYDRINDKLTTNDIAQKLGLSYSSIQRILRILKQHDLVVRVGSKKAGYWQIKE